MIEYKLFEEYMSKLKEILDASDELNNALKRVSPDFGGFFNEVSIGLILSLLSKLTHDDCDNIGYFIYELEWGTKWYKGCVTDPDDNDIPMGTMKDLYNYLKENYNED